jgi:hypothetical protein
MLLWALFFGVGLTSSFIFAYDGRDQTTVAYDGHSKSPLGFDAVSMLRAGEKNNGASGDRVLLGESAEFVAAKVTPNPRTGVGYGVTDPPVRIQGTWTEADFKAALQGRPPPSLGRPDLHHAGQMPGSAIHEVLPDVHRGNPALHPNRFNQGVTPQMRNQDRQLHWWYRAREQGADRLYPDLIYDR